MATDDKNNDPEQDDFFGDDDDDFGLPELEYEALDDDSDEDASDEEVDDFASELDAELEAELEAESESESEPEMEMEEDSSDDSSDDMSDDFGDSDDLDIPDDFGDSDDIPDQISDEELEAAMDDEISDEELNEFYEEESFDDFETSEESASDDVADSVFESGGIDDDFGSFDDDSVPDSSEEQYAAAPSFSASDKADAKGKFSRLVIIGVVIFITLGVAFLFIYNNFMAADEKPVAEKVVKKPVTKKPVAKKPVEKKEEPKEDPKPVEKPPVKTQVTSTPGTVNALAEKTGNTHVIIASFLDSDMADDYANELAAAGKSPSIIPPFGNAKTTRVAISSYPSLADAQGDIEGFKAEYGPNVWLLKY